MKTSFLAKRHYSQSLYQDTSCSCESPRSVFHALNLCACSPILIYIFFQIRALALRNLALQNLALQNLALENLALQNLTLRNIAKLEFTSQQGMLLAM